MTTKLVSTLERIFLNFQSYFSKPNLASFKTIVVGAVLNPDRQTVANMVRAARAIIEKDYTSYSRFFSKSKWDERGYSIETLKLIVSAFPQPNNLLRIPIDENLLRRKGKKVFGKCLHRDAVASSQNHLVTTYGQKWVVFCVLIQIPGARRPWALPIKLDLCWTKKHCQKNKIPYQSVIDLCQIYLKEQLKHHFPDLSLRVIVDGGYASVAFASFCRQEGIELYGKTKVTSVLYEDPPEASSKGKRGPKKKKGHKKKSLQKIASSARSPFKELRNLRWYGGQLKNLRVLSQTGLWYKPGKGLVKIKLVFVRDPKGKRPDECLYSTHINASEKEIIEEVVLRWNIEVTFEELREYLNVESMKNWTEDSVKKQTHLVFSLYSITAVWFSKFIKTGQVNPFRETWYQKEYFTFSDALGYLRREIIQDFIYTTATRKQDQYLIPRRSLDFLIANLARAA